MSTDPLTAMTDADIVRYARGVITNEYMLANATDREWGMSLALILSAWKDVPPNASVTFLVPVAAHQGGRWLNGRVPGCTFSAVCVPIENVDALLAKVQEFHTALHPGETEP